jgi:hypothetical protein
MNKCHFMKNFMETVPVENHQPDEVELHYDIDQQMLADDSGVLHFDAAYYSNAHTAGKYIKGHRSRSNKWISGRYRKSKTDRRKGK